MTMKISTKGRYGLRVLVDIATHQNNGPVILRDISKRQDISEKYLWQVINPMKSAGFVTSTRGAKGGYILAKAAANITLLDMMTVLEGPICIVDCVDDPASCQRSTICVTREVWTRLECCLKTTMGTITLKELVNQQKERASGATSNYMI